jgi:methyl-accepting chemotaxis protein
LKKFSSKNSLKNKFEVLLILAILAIFALVVSLYGVRLMSKATEFSYQERQHILSLEKIKNELNKAKIDRQFILNTTAIAIKAASAVDTEILYVEELIFRVIGKGWLIDDARESVKRLYQGESLLNYNSNQYLTSDEALQFKDKIQWSLGASAKFGQGVRNLSFFIKNLVSVMVFISISFIIFMIYRISNRSLPPLAVLVERLEQISIGQLNITVEVDENNDQELVSLQKSTVKVVNNLRSLLSEINEAIKDISLVSNNTAELTKQTLDGIKIQKTEIELLSSSICEMSLAINEVASSASSAALEASSGDKAAKEGQEVVNTAVSTITDLASEVESSVKAIERIEEGNQQIVSVVRIIKDITDQTNLLALNAAIEAAHAGEFGRGFSVVADQVRVLAEQTEKSAMDIHHMVEELGNGTAVAVDIMNNSRKSALESVEQSHKTGDVISGITNSISTITAMNEQIASAAEEQSVVTDVISGNAKKISEIALVGEINAEKVSVTNEQLLVLSKKLSDTIKVFKL